MGKSRGAMGGTEGQIYIPLGRKEEGKVDMVQQKSHGSHGKRAKLAIGLICGVALLAGMALLTHKIGTGDTKHLVTESLKSEDKSDLARSMDSWILERLATEVEGLKEEVARKNNQTAEMATGVEGLKEEVVKLKASTCTVEENMDYFGSDIAGQIRLPADDKDMCILLCAEEVRCSYWTYHTGMCWLKTSDSGRKSHPTAISGSRGCAEMATGVKGLKDEVSQLKEVFCFHGSSSYDPIDDIAGEGRSTEVSAAACQERCAGVPSCNFFSFWHDGGCHLSSSAATIKTVGGITAGPKHCPRMATAVKALKEEVVKLKASTLKDEVSQLKELFCPSPWTLLSTGCYLFDTTPRNWTDANQFCKGRFSKLIEVETNEENDALVEEFIRKDWNSLKLEPWLGLTDLKDEGTFLWSSLGQEANYTNWQPGQPNNAGGSDHCVHYDSAWNTWNDRPCDTKAYAAYGYVAVCEKI